LPIKNHTAKEMNKSYKHKNHIHFPVVAKY